jgi:flagellar motor switch protein FliN/FliY
MSLPCFFPSAVAAACRDHAAALAEAFNRCFDRADTLTPGDSLVWDNPPEALTGPGLAVRIGTTEGGLVALIPASLPLPEWPVTPDESQTSRLRTLALEWAAALLPDGETADVIEAEAVPDLAGIAKTLTEQGTEAVPLSLAEGSGTIYLLTPVTRLALLASRVEPAPADESLETRQPEPPLEPPADPQRDPYASPGRAFLPATDPPARHRLARLLNVPVQVVVRLAEKKIDMGQAIALAPGTLITFGKNCEDLLDLYVNNRLYCRGEAVKIGEHFGLKINEVGAVKRREERVF